MLQGSLVDVIVGHNIIMVLASIHPHSTTMLKLTGDGKRQPTLLMA